MLDLAYSRQRMVDQQIARRGVQDPRVLEAMREVAREAFVSSEMAEFAYEDSPLPIEAGQTISQPYVVALMLEAAEIHPMTGRSRSARLGLCRRSNEPSRQPCVHNRTPPQPRRAGPGSAGGPGLRQCRGSCRRWFERLAVAAPFDVIIAAAGAPYIPDTLRAQLSLADA